LRSNFRDRGIVRLQALVDDSRMEIMEDIVRRILKEELAVAFDTPAVKVERQVITIDSRRLYSVALVAKLLEVSTKRGHGHRPLLA
jgi:hypothetical protein